MLIKEISANIAMRFRKIYGEKLVYLGVGFSALGAARMAHTPSFSWWGWALVVAGAACLDQHFSKFSLLKIEKTVTKLSPDQAHALYADLLEKDELAAYNQAFKAYRGVKSDW